jgi:hypothetical protein
MEEKEFVWPHLEHGISRRDNVFLTTMIEKCSNDSVLTKLLGYCAPSEIIEEYIGRYFGFYMYLLDNSVDPTNYTNPLQSYFQVISTGIGNSKTFVENYIHFAPIRMRTKVGDIFGEYTDENSFFYDFNRKGTAESYNRILLKNYYLMQNNYNIYERRYSGLFDIIANLGGTSQLIYNIFFIVNFIYHRYIIIMDTNHFFCTIDNTRKNGHNSDSNVSHKIFNPLNDLKISIIESDKINKKLKKQVYSLNLNIEGTEEIKSNGNKTDVGIHNAIDKNRINAFSIFKENKIKRNNYIRGSANSASSDVNKNEIIKYMNKSNISNESYDFSNIKIKELDNINKEKRLDSIELLKEKNISSAQNNELISEYTDITTKNIKLSKLNTNKHNFPPKRNKTVRFNDNKTTNITRKKNKSQFVKPLPKVSNLNEEMKKNQKLNKEMVIISKHFEKEFSFLNYILNSCSKDKGKEKYKNLLSLVSFRRKILSENFIFQQHIINLLLGKKCDINPLEIRYIIK